MINELDGVILTCNLPGMWQRLLIRADRCLSVVEFFGLRLAALRSLWQNDFAVSPVFHDLSVLRALRALRGGDWLGGQKPLHVAGL
jgi:hypothetical protein